MLPLSSWLSEELPLPSIGSAESLRFAGWALLLGAAGSWLATWFWVIASQRLSLALSAQLIVSETVFGLLYGFIQDERLPTLIEGGSAVLMVSGVVVAVSLFQRRAGSSAARQSTA